MAIQSDTQLKTYFEENDFPTEEQFAHLIDSKYSKYSGLGTEVAVIDDEEIEIPAKRVLVRVVAWTTDPTAIINLGDDVGETQYLDGEELVQNDPRVFDIDPVFSLAAKTINVQFDDGAGNGATGTILYFIQ